MNKKYGFIFLGLGILLLVLFAIYNYTDVFNKSNNSNSNILEIESGYDYIKTKNINNRSRIIFPVPEGMAKDDFSDEYSRFYTSDKSIFNALIIDSDVLLEDFENDEHIKYLKEMQDLGYKVSNSEIECKYICKRYKIYKNDELYLDELRVYIKSSSTDIAILFYQEKNEEISSETINKIVDNIRIDNYATYKIGNIEKDKLNLKFTLENGKNVSIVLDSDKYEEIEDEINVTNRTTIKDKTNDSEIVLTIKYHVSDITTKEDIDTYYRYGQPGITVEEMKVNNKVFYEYDNYGIKGYGYIIDNNTSLLIDIREGQVELSDFININ